MKKKNVRLDQWLCTHRPSLSLPQAQTLIMTGMVKVNDQTQTKPGTHVDEDAAVEVMEGSRYVSRGGDKLKGALDFFNIHVENKTILDVGSSTGGFIDCFLQHGAKHVYAIDVGTHQLDEKLRKDSRVTCLENFHVKDLKRETFDQTFDLISVDVSFIPLQRALPFILPLIKKNGSLLALIKPQFEVAPKHLVNGVVKDPIVHESTIQIYKKQFESNPDFANTQIHNAPIKGPKGNQETFIWTTAIREPAPPYKNKP